MKRHLCAIVVEAIAHKCRFISRNEFMEKEIGMTNSSSGSPKVGAPVTQMYPQTVGEVYEIAKNTLLNSTSFVVSLADDQSKVIYFADAQNGAQYQANFEENPQGGTDVRIMPEQAGDPNTPMVAMMVFGDIMRAFMSAPLTQATPTDQTRASHMQSAHTQYQPSNGAYASVGNVQQTYQPVDAPNNNGDNSGKKKGVGLYIAIGALALAVISLIVLITCASKAGPVLVWVLGLISLACSGVALYFALVKYKTSLNTILSGVAVGISVLALILGFVNLPKGTTSKAEAKPSASSSASVGENESGSKLEESGNSGENESSSSTDTQQDSQQPTDADSLEGIIAAIQSDEEAAASKIDAKSQETIKQVGDSYESYLKNKDAVNGFYDTVNSETRTFYGKLAANTVKYFQTLSKQVEANHDLEWDDLTSDFYDGVYDGALDNFYDDVYDGAFDDIYDEIYDGALDNYPDDVDYSARSEVTTAFYKALSNERTDFYKALSDVRTDVYKLYSNIRSELYKDKYDFTADLERFQKKIAPHTNQQ